MADQTPPRRRWLQFSLGTLFVLTTLVAIWLAWELAYIRERQAWVRENAALVDQESPETRYVPATPSASHIRKLPLIQRLVPAKPSRQASIRPWRKWLGDAPVATIIDPGYWTDAHRANVVRLFPEAELIRPPPPVVGGWTSSSAPPSAPAESDPFNP